MSPSRFALFSNIGPAARYFNGVWQSEGSDYKDVQPYIPGVWQPVAEDPGRYITLSTGDPTLLSTPQNVFAMLESGHVLLVWEEVAGATYYKILSSADPYGTFSVMPGFAYDDNTGDGWVSKALAGADPYQFYKVVAAN